MPWKKGQCGNPQGAGPGRPKIADSMVLFDIKQAARSHCREAIERLAGHMRSKDERVSMLACIAMIERAYGKPEQRSDSTAVHKFAVVPEVMETAEWLARRGQPQPALLPPDDDPDPSTTRQEIRRHCEGSEGVNSETPSGIDVCRTAERKGAECLTPISLP